MNLFRSLVIGSSLISASSACSCLPGAWELGNSLQNNPDAVQVFVEREISPKDRDINDDRYWSAKVHDVFQGCGVASSTTEIVIRSGGNGASCGVQLSSMTNYLLIGRAREEEIEVLKYKGTVLRINSCTLNTPFDRLSPDQLKTLYFIKEPDCGTIFDCETCPLGFFDGCNRCFCTSKGVAACTKRLCPKGTETEPFCTCPSDTNKCPGGSVVSRDPLNECEFEACPEVECCNPMERPGFPGNPIGCRDGSQCCPDGQWSCSIGDGKTFPCGGELVTSGFGEVCDIPLVCPADVKECRDGSTVSRDPNSDCQFPECEQIFCTADVETCPDGSFVSRNPELGCDFNPCPPLDCKTCPFGYFDGCNTCGCSDGDLPRCTLRFCLQLEEPRCNPEPVVCKRDAKLCFDGSSVSRDPNNDCEFSPCPVPTCKNCPFGYNDGCNDCMCDANGRESCTERLCFVQGEPECFPEPQGCPRDTYECPDGTFVGRDQDNDCEFFECPLPEGCYELDGCYLVDLRTSPATEVELEGEDKYTLVEGESEYSIYCEAEGELNQVTFFYPNGEKDSHVEWSPPWYMRGDSGGYVHRVPYLNEGCGKKEFTVEGKTWQNVCFSVTMELEAVC